ncbi:RluA family pseudouridine synthase [Ureaplasma sp. ES3154-GEN]|uniref:RluA family pseudouridine synthase n=1 Tax=Ureaplasma sp. ES3154-GEN TaxID=2984844 RepID=UPI0021E812F2|nr:RluA family pseudouridine synthase [Ureaplasma sp. ES3154-GEN]MCV3743702.1 RluA family pseudouridine synthase [Ureaplasma sp. ES3154-GEN]
MTKNKEEIIVKTNRPKRVDKYLSANTNYSRTQIKQWIEHEHVFINNQVAKAKTLVTEEDIITYILDNDDKPVIKTKNDYVYDLEIVYEDQYFLAVNKPSGMLVHPSQFNEQNTLVNAVQYYLQTPQFYLVHRIDKHTSGIVLFAKDSASYEKVQQLFINRRVDKKYYALVANRFDDQHLRFAINQPIGYSYDDSLRMQTPPAKNTKDALSIFNVVEQYKNSALVDVQIITGRKHQIRVHSLYMNHPVLNDPLYSNQKKISDYEQFLHAYYLSFIHPYTNTKILLKTDLPLEFKEKIEWLKNHFYEEY